MIGPVDRFAVPEFAAWDWRYCRRRHLCQLSLGRQPDFCALLHLLGDIRLAARSARLEGRLSYEPPGEILWAELLDGLGFAMNREPMRQIARVVPLRRSRHYCRPCQAARERLLRAESFSV